MHNNLSELLIAQSLRTIKYFKSQLKAENTFNKNISDLACYFKLPMLFLAANEPETAQTLLQCIQIKFMDASGDFKTEKNKKSVKSEYAEYWTYTNGWIIRASQKLNLKNISEPAYHYMSQFFLETTGGVLTNKQCKLTDVLSTAHFGLVNLENGNLSLAEATGDYLCNAFIKQPESTEGFYLRFDEFGQPVKNFDQDNKIFYFVNKRIPDQLYFMLGYPSAYLTLLYKTTKNQKYLNFAQDYMAFALSCHEDILRSNFSHKIAWAASLLYQATKNDQYMDIIKKITQHFISIQDINGMWYLNSDLNTSYDQSAEIATWFLAIASNLAH